MLWSLNTSPPALFENPLDALRALKLNKSPASEMFLPSEDTGPTFWPVGVDCRALVRKWAEDALLAYLEHEGGEAAGAEARKLVTLLSTKPSYRTKIARGILKVHLMNLLPMLDPHSVQRMDGLLSEGDIDDMRLRGTGPQKAVLMWALPPTEELTSLPPRIALEVAEIIVSDMEGLNRRGWLSLQDSNLWRQLGTELDGRLLAVLSNAAVRHAGGRPTTKQVEERRAADASIEDAMEGGLFAALGLSNLLEED